MNKFIPFFFDGNQWFNTVDSPDMWKNLLKTYELEKVLDAKMAPQSDTRKASIANFGFRREHHGGTVRLEDWAKQQGMDLRELAKG